MFSWVNDFEVEQDLKQSIHNSKMLYCDSISYRLILNAVFGCSFSHHVLPPLPFGLQVPPGWAVPQWAFLPHPLISYSFLVPTFFFTVFSPTSALDKGYCSDPEWPPPSFSHSQPRREPSSMVISSDIPLLIYSASTVVLCSKFDNILGKTR